MDNNSFNAFFSFTKNEHFVYFILTRPVGSYVPHELGLELLDIIASSNAPHLPINIGIGDKNKNISLQSLRKSRTCNAIAIKHSTLLDLSAKFGFSIDYLLLVSAIFIKTNKSCQEQRKRKMAKRVIPKATTTEPSYKNKLDEWIDNNQQKLLKSSTKSENALFNRLQKTFKKRVTRQHPFVIDGKVYYADICLKSLNVIIEVDGGYHTTPEQTSKDVARDAAFASIGYTTIRCTNEQVADSGYVKQLIGGILKIKKR